MLKLGMLADKVTGRVKAAAMENCIAAEKRKEKMRFAGSIMRSLQIKMGKPVIAYVVSLTNKHT